MTTLRNYLDQITELPDDVLLGRIVMFTVSETGPRVTRSDLESWFVQESLNPGMLPAENRAIDSFKKATTDIDGTEYARPDGTTGILLTRNVTVDHEMVIRHLIREIRDTRRKLLSHEKVADLVFYKAQQHHGKVVPGTERIRLTGNSATLNGDETAVMASLQTIKQNYDTYQQYVDGQKIRATIRNYLKYLNAIEIKGGVYFIHRNRTDELLRLRNVVNKCGNSKMDQIPIIDLDNERQIVIEAFQREAEQALNDLVKEVAVLRSTRKKITPEMYAKMKQRYDTVQNQALEYQRTLNVSQTTTAAAMELALDALSELQKGLLA